MCFKKQIALLFCLIFVQTGFGQHAEPIGTTLVDSYLSKNEFSKADSVLQQHLIELQSGHQVDSLIDYTYYIGKVNLELSNAGQATKAIERFADSIKTVTSSPRSLRQLYLELGDFYDLTGNPQKAYECNLAALGYTFKMKNASGRDYGLVHSNLGTLAKRTGNLSLSMQHHKKALQYLGSDPASGKESLFITYNSLGGMMWFASKIDSALYYYGLAGNTLKELPPTPVNKYYRAAMLHNNIAGIYGSQGNMKKALETMKSTINDWNAFFNSDASDQKKESGRSAYYQAIENYAGLFKDLGDYQKARDLLAYAYEEKKKFYEPDSPELFKSKILTGQIYLAMKEYKKAEEYLDAGIAHIERIPGSFYFWNADAHYYKATLNEATGNTETASRYYAKAQSLYEKALQGAYDEIYLEFIIRASYFYAKNDEQEKALKMAYETYNYIIKNQGERTLFEFQQVLNLGEIYYVLGDYSSALEKSNEAIDLLKDRMYSGDPALDSTFIAFEKPQAVLLKVKSEYQLNDNNDTVFLKKALDELRNTISILEQKKVYAGEGLSILIADNNEIFEFTKILAMDLFSLTGDEKYLNVVFGTHESGLYNRIRSRLSRQLSVSYKDMPDTVLEKEKELKTILQDVLKERNTLKDFFEASARWDDFLIDLKNNYPEYYKLQYASITEPDKNIWPDVPENTTVVRYVFIGDSLYVLVIGREFRRILKLNRNELGARVAKVSSGLLPFKEVSIDLNRLYVTLWEPFESLIQTKNVVIIPDRELFNLSFEILTPYPIKSYAELAGNSLLARHAISYNYSLLLLHRQKESPVFNENFVAFVPEFNDKMKEDYRISVTDSLSPDKTYLTLLPQPFSLKLAKTSEQLFDGKSFLNGQSTKQIFMNSAREHKIIHIGTHAESNNLSPELSRLVFAKPITGSRAGEDNYLYAYEIYNCNLSSDLTILTACETGKPAWQPGEGMISLAHAFHYAGSESILTSLWKIDEKSSSQIVKLFYDRLSAGLPKDKALQQAKLEYLKTENGRALSPKYWAGLILIGDTSPIPVSASGNRLIWFFGILVLLGAGFYFFRKKQL
ncbi:MAG: CHAT domain-containing protein [Chlorobi bacterium]|nr:CHAT domain-containing protein [Chlorobiota bacterium]